jgi:hypothetical protein
MPVRGWIDIAFSLTEGPGDSIARKASQKRYNSLNANFPFQL